MEENKQTSLFEGKSGRAFLITLVVLAVVAIVFIVVAVRASGTISANNDAIAALQKQVAADNAQISTLKGQVAADNTQIATLKDQVASAQSQLTAASSQVTTLQGQATSLQGQITSLQNDNKTLQAQKTEMQGILNLSVTTNKLNGVTLNQGGNQFTLASSFSAQYAGYVTVTGTSTAQNGYIRVADTYNGYPFGDQEYPFGTSRTLVVPVLPGDINVYFGNHNDAGSGATATLTVSYTY